MGKRPLCVAVLLLAIGIAVVHSRWEKILPVYEDKEMSLVCELEEITEKDGSYTLLVRDIWDSQKLLCHRMKLYTGENTELPD